jgi:hypothetical protein
MEARGGWVEGSLPEQSAFRLEIPFQQAMLTGMIAPKPKRRPFQFSLRTLLIVITLCAIPCSWLAVTVQNAEKHRKATLAISREGGVFFTHALRVPNPGPPDWRERISNYFFPEEYEIVSFCGKRLTHGALKHVEDLLGVQELVLNGTSDTDAGLAEIKGLTQLKTLTLESSEVTDAGLENLKGLSQLQTLDLGGTKVTDAGLENLKELGQFKVLDLQHTKVTAEGVKKLQQALPNCTIDR